MSVGIFTLPPNLLRALRSVAIVTCITVIMEIEPAAVPFRNKRVTFAISPNIHPKFTTRPKRNAEIHVQFQDVVKRPPDAQESQLISNVVTYVTQFQADSTTNVRCATKVNFLKRKSHSSVDLRQSRMTNFHIQAFNLHEKKVQTLAQSMWSLNRTDEKTDWKSLEPRILNYLRRTRFPPFPRTKLLETGDDFYHIFTFMCGLPQARRFEILKFVPRWRPEIGAMTVGERLALRTSLMERALIIERSCLKTNRLRKTDMVNPLAFGSRPRIVAFLFGLILYIQNGKN